MDEEELNINVCVKRREYSENTPLVEIEKAKGILIAATLGGSAQQPELSSTLQEDCRKILENHISIKELYAGVDLLMGIVRNQEFASTLRNMFSNLTDTNYLLEEE